MQRSEWMFFGYCSLSTADYGALQTKQVGERNRPVDVGEVCCKNENSSYWSFFAKRAADMDEKSLLIARKLRSSPYCLLQFCRGDNEKSRVLGLRG
jgi:hypothetical protein